MILSDSEMLKRLEGVLSLFNRYVENEGFSEQVVRDEIIDLIIDINDSVYPK